ncbi:MAG: hypothetical protein F6J92_29435, partial [Symploca sp. SIO1A3]|nr:hypothetical protein [Symploca sp. SIO1A3]
MLQICYKSGLFSSVMLGAMLLMGVEAMAAETMAVAEELTIVPLSEANQQPAVSSSREEPTLVAQISGDGSQTNLLEQIKDYNRSAPSSLGQVTSVNDLLDVSPGDWAYDALRELVEDYKCIVGYPD